MKEFDFEELDRAVNSLMKGAPASTPVKADDDVTTVTLPDDTTSAPKNDDSQSTSVTTSETKEPVTDAKEGEEGAKGSTDSEDANAGTDVAADEDTTTVDSQEIKETETTESQDNIDNIDEPKDTPEEPTTDTPKPEVAAPTSTPVKQSTVPHRKGRFMDVKHDPSMMRPSSSASTSAPTSTKEAIAAPSKRASREAATLQPTADPVETTPRPPESAPIADVTTPAAEKTQDTPPVSKPDNTEATPSTGPVDNAPDTTEKPAEYSAFLPDAKVDKRPLGKPQTTTAAPTPVSAPDTPTPAGAVAAGAVDEKTGDSSDVGTPAAPEAELSAEYDQHLMAIESGDTSTDMPDPIAEDQKKSPVTPPSDNSTTDTPAPNGPTSIQQQYKESPSSGDQTNGAIYDTASYHQPLKHPEKKKTGWLWVVLIVIVILLGIGGGAFIYLNGM